MLWLDHSKNTGSVSAVRCDLPRSSCLSPTDYHALGEGQVPPGLFIWHLIIPFLSFPLATEKKIKMFLSSVSFPLTICSSPKGLRKRFQVALPVSNWYFPSQKLKGWQCPSLQKCCNRRALYKSGAGWTAAYCLSSWHPPEMLTQHAFFQRASEVLKLLQKSKKIKGRKERRKGNKWYMLALDIRKL